MNNFKDHIRSLLFGRGKLLVIFFAGIFLSSLINLAHIQSHAIPIAVAPDQIAELETSSENSTLTSQVLQNLESLEEKLQRLTESLELELEELKRELEIEGARECSDFLLSARIDAATFSKHSLCNRLSTLLNGSDTTNTIEDYINIKDLIESLEKLENNSLDGVEQVYTYIYIVQSLLRISQDLTNMKGILEILDWNELSILSKEAVNIANRITGDQGNGVRAKSWAIGYLGHLSELQKQGESQENGEHQVSPSQTQYCSLDYEGKTAEELTKCALELAYSLRRNAVAESASQANDLIYQWAWQLGRVYKLQGNKEQSLEYYEIAFETSKMFRNELLAADIETQLNFRDRIEPLYREYVDLLLPPNNSDQLASLKLESIEPTEEYLQEEQIDIIKVIEDLRLAEIENLLDCNLEIGNPRNSDQVSITQVASENQAAILYTIVLKDRLEILLKLPTRDDLLQYPSLIKSNQEINSTLKLLRYVLEKPYFSSKQGVPVANDLYDWLIRPAEEEGFLDEQSIQTLVFIPDGEFRNIPIAALLDKESNRFLVQKYAIATALSDLTFPKVSESGPLRGLIAGVYEPPGGENSQLKEEYSSLKFVPLEVTYIKNLLQRSKLLCSKDLYEILNNDCNERLTSDTLAEEMTSYRNLVHIATHGQFDGTRKETYLLLEEKLEGQSSISQEFNNKFNLEEMEALVQTRVQSPIDLLVLSACETASGDDRAVLGIAGMAIQVGARSTMSSLWSINDASTTVLMKSFYDKLITENLPKAEALRQAQIALVENPAYKPSDWAPYMLIGDWRALIQD